MSSDESDIEIKSALNKKKKMKLIKSPSIETLKNTDPKKISTKTMVRAALTDLKPSYSRKGVSIQAIKKYINEKYNFDVYTRYSYILKKFLKSAVEAGMIIQVKGIGASGSFRLANTNEKITKKKKRIAKEVKSKDVQTKEDKMKAVEEKKKKLIKPKKAMVNDSKTKGDKKAKKINDSKEDTSKKTKPIPIKAKTDKNTKQVKEKTEKKKKVDIKNDEPKKEKIKKNMKVHKTPAKKRATMMKRKSIGTIIKPPKMKPKAK